MLEKACKNIEVKVFKARSLYYSNQIVILDIVPIEYATVQPRPNLIGTDFKLYDLMIRRQEIIQSLLVEDDSIV